MLFLLRHWHPRGSTCHSQAGAIGFWRSCPSPLNDRSVSADRSGEPWNGSSERPGAEQSVSRG